MPSVAHAIVFEVRAGDVARLIAVINEANDEASKPGPDTISLLAGTFTLTAPLPSITSRVVISGDSPNVIIERASGAPNFRIFHVSAGGALTLLRLTIRGGNSVNPDFGGGGILNEGTLTLNESTVSGNRATGRTDPGGDGSGGGGITNRGRAILINSTITDNRSTSSGGGIENFGNAKLTLINTSVTRNMADFDGGGIENSGTAIIRDSFIGDNNRAGRFGGGINNFLVPTGSVTLTLANSSISGNTANLDGGGFENSATATLTNSTISGNRAGRLGSGIGNFATLGTAGILNVNNVTVTSNSGSQGASGVSGFFNAAGNTVNISNTIIAQNAGNDCQGTFNSLGFNLIGNNSGSEASFPVGNPNANNDIVGNSTNPIDAMLGPLQNRGPQTLLSGSPAIDAGNPAPPGSGGNASELTDQRGLLRPADGPDTDSIATCDIGAFEFGASSPFSSQIKIPIRWCCVEGSPSIQNPALVGENSINDVLLRRLTRVNDNIYIPQPNMLFRSGINSANPNLNFPVIPDPNTAIGKQGDVLLPTISTTEFMQLINTCRAVWGERDKTVTGITAVHINRFVDNTGTPVRFSGFGGGSFFSNSATQLERGNIMVIDNAYLLPTSTLPQRSDDPFPLDRDDRFDILLGHELGHALTLEHGNGVDDDGDGELDERGEEDDSTNGSNLMQYRNGTTITPDQSNRIRSQSLMHIPDRVVDPMTPPLANAGVDALGDISAGEAFVDINDFGVAVDQNAGTTTFFSSTAGLFPENISDLSYIFLADLDNNPGTGGSPANIGIPTTASGIEMIGQVQVDVINGSPQATPTVLIFRGGQFVAVSDPGIQAKVLTTTIRLYQDYPPLLPDEEPISQNIQLEVPSSLVPPMSMEIALHAMAENPSTGTRDNAEAALTFEVPTFPSCQVTPAIVIPRDKVTVTASDLPPGVTARVFLGPDLVAIGPVNGSGNATIPFVIPEDVAAGSRSVTVVVEETAITADCSVVVIAGLINDSVSFEPIRSTFKTTSDTTGCTLDDTTEDAFVGQFSFNARLRNTSNSSLAGLVVKVTELTNGNVLQNADGGPGGVGARLTVPVPDEGDYADGILAPEEFVDVHFIICLKVEKPFTFVVDVLGSVEAGETDSSQVTKTKATNTEPKPAKFRKGSRITGKGFFGRFRPK